MLVRKTKVVPIECVVRGYLAGSGWKEYQRAAAGLRHPAAGGLRESDQLPEPIFTPATKDETRARQQHLVRADGRAASATELAEELRRRSLAIYERGAEHAPDARHHHRRHQVRVGPTSDDELILIDEVLTPDSSRFWPADDYQPGGGQPSFDKQFVRDWLETSGWDKNSPPPPLPDDVVAGTRAKYVEAYEKLSGMNFSLD